MRTPTLVHIVLIFSFLLQTGCSLIPVAERAEAARSILKADKVLVLLNLENLPHKDMPFQVGSSVKIGWGYDKTYTEGRRIMDTYGVTNPLGGIKNNFLQSLPSEILHGEIVHDVNSGYDLLQYDGWIVFTQHGWQLQGSPLLEYRLTYSAQAKILHNSGKTSKDGRIFMSTLWQEVCNINKPGEFKGHPLTTWLDDGGVLLKETMADLQVTCGQELAQDMLEFLEH